MAQSPWVNDDGLVIKYGTEEAKSEGVSGEVAGHVAGEKVLEVVIDLENLTATETIVSYHGWLPQNALITALRVVSLETAATGTAIDVGLVYYSGTTLTELDYNGLLAAHVTASMAIGESEKFVLDNAAVTGVWAALSTGGALIGTELATTASKYYVSASNTDGTAFTAGKVRLFIHYIPQGIDEDNIAS